MIPKETVNAETNLSKIGKNTSLSNTTTLGPDFSFMDLRCIWDFGKSLILKGYSIIHGTLGYILFFIKTILLWILMLIKETGSWIFQITVVTPLNAFYFETILEGLPQNELCARITTHTEASFWEKNNETILECQTILDRKFRSFEVSVLMSIYFAFIAAMLFRLFFWVCCGKWKRR